MGYLLLLILVWPWLRISAHRFSFSGVFFSVFLFVSSNSFFKRRNLLKESNMAMYLWYLNKPRTLTKWKTKLSLDSNICPCFPVCRFFPPPLILLEGITYKFFLLPPHLTPNRNPINIHKSLSQYIPMLLIITRTAYFYFLLLWFLCVSCWTPSDSEHVTAHIFVLIQSLCCSSSPSVPRVTYVIRTTFCLLLAIAWLKLSWGPCQLP